MYRVYLSRARDAYSTCMYMYYRSIMMVVMAGRLTTASAAPASESICLRGPQRLGRDGRAASEHTKFLRGPLYPPVPWAEPELGGAAARQNVAPHC